MATQTQATAPRARQQTPRRRLLADRLARWVVTAGGLAIIASILGILIFIIVEVLPLVRGARLRPGPSWSLEQPAAAILTDEYRANAAVLSADGTVRVYELEEGRVVLQRTIADDVRLDRVGVVPGAQTFSGSTGDGRAVALPFDWRVDFVGQDRVVSPAPGEPVLFDFDETGRAVGPFALRVNGEGRAAGAALLADGELVLLRREVEENLFTGETSESWSRTTLDAPAPPERLLLDSELRNLYGSTASGELLWWDLDDDVVARVELSDGAAVTALGLLLGDRSLVVGRNDGVIEVWYAVRAPDGQSVLTRIREFPALDDAVRMISPSMRDKGFLALGNGGSMALDYSTSARELWNGRAPIDEPRALFYAPKGDAVLIGGTDRLAELQIANRHPEVGLRALFGKVWYESYPEPEYVWQSSGGTDDFESKLSLTPLMIGTLKGTVYSLFLAIPLGVLGAMYTSQFMHPSLKRYVKPTVEIMAALPSVVLGFLAGLWLAPRVERILPGLVAALIVVPLLVLIAGLAWKSLSTTRLSRLAAGLEVPLYMAVVAFGMWLALALSAPVERFVFGGSFPDWLRETTGLPYDQRNAVVVGLAMGFAVIPIIFSIAEDAFSNVPRSLTSGSLALGANRWQTVTRVVLPSASPGIFSAIMIGFGRAIGETMIVLMATGNTPIMDWNPFNGFRTLSANIAVEIPEAPHGGTLYRVLFLAALLLFIFTFVINTAAELIRQRLRERYQQ